MVVGTLFSMSPAMCTSGILISIVSNVFGKKGRGQLHIKDKQTDSYLSISKLLKEPEKGLQNIGRCGEFMEKYGQEYCKRKRYEGL